MTAHTTQPRRLATVTALATALVAALVTTAGLTGAASADVQDVQDVQQSDYVAQLLAKAEDAKPYSQSEDYVRTLVYWHHNPDWGFGS